MTMLFQLANLAIVLLLIYGFAVIVKAAKKVIMVSDIYLAEHEKKKEGE